MSALQRAATLSEAYRLLDPLRPLEGEWLDPFYAARQVRSTYRALLTPDQYRELQRIARGGRFANTPLAQELLHNLSLLEYNGEGAWWAIHPIVRPLVEEWSRESEGG